MNIRKEQSISGVAKFIAYEMSDLKLSSLINELIKKDALDEFSEKYSFKISIIKSEPLKKEYLISWDYIKLLSNF